MQEEASAAGSQHLLLKQRMTEHMKRAWYVEYLSFIVALITAIMAHRKSTSDMTPFDSCGTQQCIKETRCACIA
jgi:hypothetical protein